MNNFYMPKPNIITIYTKSNCPFCVKVKEYLTNKKIVFEVIDCDEYLLEFRELFISFIKSLTNLEKITFPLVFNNQIYIGGCKETQKYFE